MKKNYNNDNDVRVLNVFIVQHKPYNSQGHDIFHIIFARKEYLVRKKRIRDPE